MNSKINNIICRYVFIYEPAFVYTYKTYILLKILFGDGSSLLAINDTL